MTKKVSRFQQAVVIGSVLTIGSLSLASPVSAANPLSGITQSIKARLQKVYLMLPGPKNGAAVLSQSTTAMQEVKSAELGFGLEFKGYDSTNTEIGSGRLDLTGPFSLNNVYEPSSLKQDMRVKMAAQVDGEDITVDAEVKLDGEVLYIKLNQLPTTPAFDGTAFLNQWIKIDPKALSAGMGAEVTTEQPAEATMTPEQQRQMQQAAADLIQKSEISQARKETINSHQVYVVDVMVADQDLVAYLDQVAEIQKVSATDRAQTKKAWEDGLSQVDELKLSIAVDRSSFYVRQVSLPLKITMPASTEGEASPLSAVSAAGAEVTSATLTATMTMDKFNEPVTFTAPTDARDIQEIMMELMSGVGGGVGMMGSSSGATMPKLPATIPATRPTELPELTAEEEKILMEYGIQLENL